MSIDEFHAARKCPHKNFSAHELRNVRSGSSGMKDLPPKPANPARSSPGHLATSAVSALLLCLGVGLVILGALNLDNCPKEEALPVWMVSAGSTLIVITR